MERLAGKAILVVEDDFFIATGLRGSLEMMGVQVLGPVGRVDDALALIARSERIDAALLDLNLHGVMAYPVADALSERRVPFMFITGYDHTAIPERFSTVPHSQKLVAPEAVCKAFFS
jgi:CheY-like chemotaxis protein